LRSVQQDLLTAINSPSLAMTQHPLIGNETSRATGVLGTSGAGGSTGAGGTGGPLPGPAGSGGAGVTGGPAVAFILEGTAQTFPNPSYLASVNSLFIQPLFSGFAPAAFSTPEQLAPFYGSLTLGQSISQGLSELNGSLTMQLSTTNQPVVVFGYSQSAAIATDEIRNLIAMGSPDTNELSFILTGDLGNPDGGLFERFTGAYLPVLDWNFNGATPPLSPYHTVIYTNEYDGIADFPEFVLDPISDANAVAGIFFGAHDYSSLSPQMVADAIQLPTSPGYAGNTAYYLIPTQNLSLLAPVRMWVPAPYGNEVADLLQPDLRVFVDLGYGSGEYANLPTPARLLEFPNWPVVGQDLVHGAFQGGQALMADHGHGIQPTGYPATPVADPEVNLSVPQTGGTGLSQALGFEGQILQDLGIVPSWDTDTVAG
jgi:hypothetical protein